MKTHRTDTTSPVLDEHIKITTSIDLVAAENTHQQTIEILDTRGHVVETATESNTIVKVESSDGIVEIDNSTVTKAMLFNIPDNIEVIPVLAHEQIHNSNSNNNSSKRAQKRSVSPEINNIKVSRISSRVNESIENYLKKESYEQKSVAAKIDDGKVTAQTKPSTTTTTTILIETNETSETIQNITVSTETVENNTTGSTINHHNFTEEHQRREAADADNTMSSNNIKVHQSTDNLVKQEHSSDELPYNSSSSSGSNSSISTTKLINNIITTKRKQSEPLQISKPETSLYIRKPKQNNLHEAIPTTSVVKDELHVGDTFDGSFNSSTSDNLTTFCNITTAAVINDKVENNFFSKMQNFEGVLQIQPNSLTLQSQTTTIHHSSKSNVDSPVHGKVKKEMVISEAGRPRLNDIECDENSSSSSINSNAALADCNGESSGDTAEVEELEPTIQNLEPLEDDPIEQKFTDAENYVLESGEISADSGGNFVI